MSVETRHGIDVLAEFVAHAAAPAAARQRAAAAIADTVGVMVAGAVEPVAQLARAMAAEESRGDCVIVGTRSRAGADAATLANGVAAHALDYDDMCFVSLAHPSCALVPAVLAAGETVHASGARVLDGYVAGFELECRLGIVMNPRHYHQRGWHCTSSIGTLGAAAAAAHVLGLDARAVRHALGIAASAACGFKENMGSMVKPLHAGLAARNGLMAARLAQRGFTSSPEALDGPQGYLAVMDSEHRSLDAAMTDLGSRWEILDTGITVKLYPSCAATHPPLDALLDLRQREGIRADAIAGIEVEVDSMTPRLLIHERPATGLAAKFSMPFCAAAAFVFGRIGIDTFAGECIDDPAVRRLMPLVTMRANPPFDTAAPLSRARVTVTLLDGRTVTASADGARGYPGRLSPEELAAKFSDCVTRTMTMAAGARAWTAMQAIESMDDVRELTALLAAE
jgi:2-methylcitrate dehydratase PrpD